MAKEEFDYEDEEFEDFDDEFEDDEDQEEKEDKKKKKEKVQLPVFLELIYSFTMIMTLLMTLVVAIMSFLNGATWLDVFIRTAITIMSVGLLGWALSSMVASGAKKTLTVLQEEALEAYKNGGLTEQSSEENELNELDENMDVEQSEE